MDFTSKKLPPNPLSKANPISKILFLWVFPLFAKGYSKDLEEEDLYDILKEDQTERVGDELERLWNQEQERAKRTGGKPSLFRAIVKMSWKVFALTAIVYIFNQCVLVVAQPIFLRLLILTFNEKDGEPWKGYAYAGAITLVVFLGTLTIHPGVFQIMHLAMKLRVATSTLIYRKSLRLSKAAQNKTNSGQIVNLLSNDCTRFDVSINFIPFIASAPFQIVIFMYLLYQEIGLSCLAGFAFVVLLLPMQYYLGKYSAIFRMKIAKRTDERGRFMNEIIIGMRVIKQYAWEKPFSVLIAGIRKLEVVELRKRALLRGLHFSVFTFAPKLVVYLTLVVFLLLEDEPMTADKVFFTLTILHTLIQIMVHFTPQAASGLGEVIVAVKRIQEFLLLEEVQSNKNLALCTPPKIGDEGLKLLSSGKPVDTISWGAISNDNEPIQKRVSLENVSASWTGQSRLTLDNISFSVEDDKLVMIVGTVGSSKTSLLHTLIDELPISTGKLSITGTVSYASQEPWIFAGNLRQNILFGLPYKEQHYNEVLHAAALKEDLKQLPYGDMTIVGERGVALSGGQKARVNLARALYRKSDIYLLDDPLSALDTKVGRHIFESCIKKYLKGSIRILVTHQLQFLPQADYIIVLHQGKILGQGSFQELEDSGIDFVSLMQSGDSPEEENAKRNSVSQMVSVAEQTNSSTTAKPTENVEKKAGGSVTFKTYRDYFMSGHSVFGFSSLLFTFLFVQLVISGNDYWLSFWTNAEQKRIDISIGAINCTEPDDYSCRDTYLGENTYLYVYTGFVATVTLFNLCRSLWFYLYCSTISVNVHDKMFRSMVRAPVRFFDDNPSGRIMNRFTKDVGTLDEMLPPAMLDTAVILLNVIGALTVVIIANYYMSVPSVILFICLYFIRQVFVQTARDIKRIESITRSPVFTHVTATLQGLATIRACKSQDILIKQFEGNQDIHSSSWFLFLGAKRGFGIWLELISDVFLGVAAFSFLLISSSEQGGNVGLAISSLLTMMGGFQWGMRQSAETENYMTSVERALEYSRLTPEAELESKSEHKPPSDWPKIGKIEFKNVSLSYEEGKPVLKDLSFEIKGSEKIAVVGRTGAGKSTIIAALFRLTEPQGYISIDDVDVTKIGLHDLRKNISIIPQDPVLFSGTVRYNLDPFSQFEDIDLWNAIEQVELKDAVPSLDYQVADGGSNFSVGQRQLVCLARALLRKNTILVMDEATANVDPRTDKLIQQTIRSKFAHCSIITIAHRLHSIIDCNRILVLDHGEKKEYDHPHILLQNTNSIFSKMVAQTGAGTEAMLKRLAKEAYTHSPDEID